MNIRPTWFLDDDETIDDECFDLEWRTNCIPKIDSVVEAVIENFVFVEYTFETTITESKNRPQDVGKTCKSPWLMNSVEIHTSKGVYAVFNALDTNGIETKPAVGEEFRRLPLV